MDFDPTRAIDGSSIALNIAAWCALPDPLDPTQ
jgi:hypothetical protein